MLYAFTITRVVIFEYTIAILNECTNRKMHSYYSYTQNIVLLVCEDRSLVWDVSPMQMGGRLVEQRVVLTDKLAANALRGRGRLHYHRCCCHCAYTALRYTLPWNTIHRRCYHCLSISRSFLITTESKNNHIEHSRKKRILIIAFLWLGSYYLF